MEKFEYYKNYQNVTASKMWANAAGENGAIRFTWYRVAKNWICKKCCIGKIAIKWGMYKVCFRTSVDKLNSALPSPQGIFQICVIEIFLLSNDTNFCSS